jgi:hypothetical protein
MNKILTMAATFAAALALAGGAWAQASSGDTPPSGDKGAIGTDANGSRAMPAEVVPDSMMGATGTSTSSSGTESSAAPSYTIDQRIPTRAEVRAEAASMSRSGMIPRGELSTAFQDRGAQIGSTPY